MEETVSIMMSRRWTTLLLVALLLPAPHLAKQEAVVCGTNRERRREELHLHRRAAVARAKASARRLAAAPAARDIGDIAILEDSDGVVARRNPFDLDQKTVTFTASGANASAYRFQTGAGSYDVQAALNGVKIEGFEDDDTRQISVPFAFPFYGTVYQNVFVNSDGNLTFGSSDTASSERSMGRVTSGPPRIAGLFEDLDPSKSLQGVRVLSEQGRLVVSWVAVPEFQDFGIGPLQTFQIQLYPDGKIEFAYSGVSASSAVVGISPGGLLGETAVVSFADGSALQFTGTVAERFGGVEEIDMVTTAQKFFETHEDAYDYLVVFNNLEISAGSGALAWEMTLRNNRTGYGDILVDDGREYGSASRLQAVMNMGPLSQYPADTSGKVGGRGLVTGDTPLTILAHEAGHLFLAYASVHDPGNVDSLPMLNNVNFAHWSFFFNSDASYLEGNRIRDDGLGVSPRFTTTATVQGFSELDQYLMGFRAPEEVTPLDHDLFYVASPSIGSFKTSSSFPQAGLSFDGTRRDVALNDLITIEGRRTPDHTVAQRRFRFGFVLVVGSGTEPSQADITKIDTFRREFETLYGQAASGRASADATLRRSLKLSVFPASGVVAGSSISASLTIAAPTATPLAVSLKTPNGVASAPVLVTIPAGSTSVGFPIVGIKAGVEEMSAEPADPQYERAYARIQTLANRTTLELALVSGDLQGVAPNQPLAEPVVFRVVDLNRLPYPGITVQASVADGGTVSPASAVSDMGGLVGFNWTPGTGSDHRLTAVVQGVAGSAVSVVLAAAPGFPANGVVNAASYSPGLSPGGFASIFGSGLTAGGSGAAAPPFPQVLWGSQVWLDSRPLPLHYAGPAQINFLVPLDVTPGDYDLRVTSEIGVSASLKVHVLRASPGIFFNSTSGFGAVVVAGTVQTTDQRGARPGEYLEIYATGLGTVQRHPTLPEVWETVLAPKVLLGSSTELPVTFSGLTPGYPGLYQVNVQIPAGTAAGEPALSIEVNGVTSNAVKIRILLP